MPELQTEHPTTHGASHDSPYYSRPEIGGQLHQGELLRNVWEWDTEYDKAGKPIGARPRIHRLAVILTQVRTCPG